MGIYQTVPSEHNVLITALAFDFCLFLGHKIVQGVFLYLDQLFMFFLRSPGRLSVSLTEMCFFVEMYDRKKQME